MRILSVILAAMALAPSAARAQDSGEPVEAPPGEAVAPEPSSVPEQAVVAQPQASPEQQIQELKEELARRDEEALLARERESVDRDRLIRIYGFADVGGKHNTTPEEPIFASRFSTPYTFYLGRLNLYFDSHPAQDFRFLAETRFSLYPNGSSEGMDSYGRVIRTSTSVSDVSSPNPQSSQSWGGVILERAALDWTRYPLFSVRVGLFLTPFGIYNVDHGTPTLISITQPLYIGLQWIPERQLGLQIFGSLPIERWEIGYAATLSNGRGNQVLDVSNEKTLGGRVFVRRQGALSLQLGASAVYQPAHFYQEQFGIDASGAVTYTKTLDVQYASTTVGGDLSLDYAGLRVRSEILWYRNAYETGKRDTGTTTLSGLNPDERDVNWDVLVAYRWWKLEPYGLVNVFHCSPTLYLGTNVVVPGVGLNLYLRPNVILKASFIALRFYKDNDPERLAARRNFETTNLLLTWAF